MKNGTKMSHFGFELQNHTFSIRNLFPIHVSSEIEHLAKTIESEILNQDLKSPISFGLVFKGKRNIHYKQFRIVS